ncbi:MAG: hypothetical protein QXJ21_01515 [Thermofilum sp.]|uniref:Uncharacterized protein n=1 Tax=Thermofilum pendens TaxID=2269 RepID=A0A7C4H3R8_THEPE
MKAQRRGYRLALLAELARRAAREGRTLDDLLFEAIEEYLWSRGQQPRRKLVEYARPSEPG